MSNITIVLNTDNEAMQDGEEISRILNEIADDFAQNNTEIDEYFTTKGYKDINGNTVATVDLELDEEV